MSGRIAKLYKDSKSSDCDINLLLFGGTGVGKSTFINSISNYFKYRDFQSAKKGTVQVLIPVSLNLSNSNVVYGASDKNKSHDHDKLATQHAKVYLFPIKVDDKVYHLRIVDSPGVGDPRGIDYDNIYIDNILAYLATLKKLHGICFILKSNETRFTRFVEYCLKQVLTRLDKSASNNIIFITTYSKSTQYIPTDTKINCLEPLVNNIKSKPPHVDIPLTDKNVFALDNESFKALLEMQEGKKFSKHEVAGFSESWKVSSKACRRLLKYIIGDENTSPLQPHAVESTIKKNFNCVVFQQAESHRGEYNSQYELDGPGGCQRRKNRSPSRREYSRYERERQYRAASSTSKSEHSSGSDDETYCRSPVSEYYATKSTKSRSSSDSVNSGIRTYVSSSRPVKSTKSTRSGRRSSEDDASRYRSSSRSLRVSRNKRPTSDERTSVKYHTSPKPVKTIFNRILMVFKDPQATRSDINLLLFGETGVGKSTFINSLANYFNYSNFEEAQHSKIEVLISVSLNLSDRTKICGTADKNERHVSGKSATQHVKVYLFPIKMGRKTFNLRLVDTPGVGDPRGMDQDNTNLDNILAYLATLKKLHAICFIMKSNQTRFTKFVEYCLKQMLVRLDKSASQNIIFITTSSKITQYKAGDARIHCLEPLVRDIQSKPPNVSIPLGDKNIFALDNEAFKALLEMREGKTFSKHELESLANSWDISSKEIRRLLAYIIGDGKTSALKPHEVENTISVNEVRFMIEQLATPIAEVSDLIQDNLRVLERHKRNLSLENQTLDELKKKLFIPCVNLKVKELSQPVTVCTESKCTEIIKVNHVTQWHYKQRCHNPCHLPGIPKERIGDPGIINCAAMSGKDNCQRCGCHWKVHMHIYKETEKMYVQTEDQNVKIAINTKRDGQRSIKKFMQTVNQKMRELKKEGKIISENMAKISYFLQEHALTPYNDAYSDYIKQIIKNEEFLGKFGDKKVIVKLEKLLSRHEHLQKTFQENAQKFKDASTHFDLNLEGIKKSITELYRLKHMGKTIQELIKKSTASRQRETQKNFECVMSKGFVLEDGKKKVQERKQRKVVDENEVEDDVDANFTPKCEVRCEYRANGAGLDDYDSRESSSCNDREDKTSKHGSKDEQTNNRNESDDSSERYFSCNSSSDSQDGPNGVKGKRPVEE